MAVPVRSVLEMVCSMAAAIMVESVNGIGFKEVEMSVSAGSKDFLDF